VTEHPHREPPPGTQRHYGRIHPDMTDEEIDAWAEDFVEAVLGGESGAPGPTESPR
jgi:hypothetical protein